MGIRVTISCRYCIAFEVMLLFLVIIIIIIIIIIIHRFYRSPIGRIYTTAFSVVYGNKRLAKIR